MSSSAPRAEQPGNARLRRQRLRHAGEAASGDPGRADLLPRLRRAAECVDERRHRSTKPCRPDSTQAKQSMRASGERTAVEEPCGIQSFTPLQQQWRTRRARLHDDSGYMTRWLHRSSRAVRPLPGASSSTVGLPGPTPRRPPTSSFPLYDESRISSSTNFTIVGIRGIHGRMRVCAVLGAARLPTWT